MAMSYCYWRPKKYPPIDAKPGEEWFYTNHHEWNDDACCKHCKVTREQAVRDGATGAAPYPLPTADETPLRVPAPAPGEPSFYIEVISSMHMGESFPRISWHCAGGFNRPMRERRQLLGRYACHRVESVGVAVPLIEPQVEISVELANELLEAFTRGAVRQAAVTELASAIRAAQS